MTRLFLIMITVLASFLVEARTVRSSRQLDDSVVVVKGQVSDYFIPVNHEYTVSGQVTDSTGQPLEGATVMWLASPVHCNTKADGNYMLKATDGDTLLYTYYPGLGFTQLARRKDQRHVNIRMVRQQPRVVLPRVKAMATRWYDPEDCATTTYCNPLNISYNYEPFNDNVRQGGCFRSSADPMALTYKGQYLLFSTNQGGYHHSKNLSDWDFQTATFKRHPTDDDQCAPAAFVSNDTLYYTGSTYEGLPLWFTTQPETGRWRQAIARNSLPSWDPCLFLDDDGRLYLYYGSSNEYPIKAVELSRQTFEPIGKIYDVVLLHPEKHGWERFGMNNDDEVTLKPFMEGAWMTKHDGRYYLQYGAPGTEFKVYADGVYVGDSPLGPFTYQKLNPMCYKPGGFVQGTGHGGTFQDLHGQYWHVATCMLSLKYKFERRIGLYPTYFDNDGVMYANTAFGDYPQRNADYQGRDRFTGWMLLSLGKHFTCSSTDTLDVSNLGDENIRTYWSAATGNPGEWVSIDLGHNCSVRAIQLNFYDHGSVQCDRANDIYYQYRIWASDDNHQWTLVVDKSQADRDTPHDYVELREALDTRYLKVENLHMPANGKFCLSEMRVFGKADIPAPNKVSGFRALRDKKDSRNVMLSWLPAANAYGYNIYYGVEPGKLYHCITVNGATQYDFRGLDKGTNYYFSIQALGEGGCSETTTNIKS